MTRQSLLAATSVSLVAAAGLAVITAASTAAQAQDLVPVTFGTDPGEAHPRYAQLAAYEPSGPAQLEFVSEESASELAPGSVTVEPGDTVYGLARRHGLTPAALIEANGLAAPYTLALGQTLVLPAAAPESEPEPVAVAAAPTPPAAAKPSALTERIERVDEREEGAQDERRSLDALYTVAKGDTLYSLSRRFGVDVSDLAAANGLVAPYALSLGQKVVIPAADGEAPAPALSAAAPEAEVATAEPAPTPVAPLVTGGRFDWPLRGPIVASYGASIDGQRNDGINIAAPAGTPVRASADGEVVYRGDELAGYGNLVLVKHADGWVSAYAHTGVILVKKGDRVRRGQVIAKVGQTGAVDGPQLHFELRRDLRPQDPVAALGGLLEAASYGGL